MGFRRAAGRLTGLLSGASQLKHPFTAPTLKPTFNRRPLRGYFILHQAHSVVTSLRATRPHCGAGEFRDEGGLYLLEYKLLRVLATTRYPEYGCVATRKHNSLNSQFTDARSQIQL